MLRVATYNVRGLKDDRKALVRVIRALRPDVLCLQEAPRLPGWRRERRALVRAAGLSVAAGGRVGGTAVLTAPAVRLLHGRGHRLRWFPGLEWRSTALAVVEKTVEKDRERYAVCSAHLDLLAGARLRHAAQIVALLERAAGEFGAAPVLAGDLNEIPGAPVWRLLGGRYTDCFAAVRGPAPRIGADEDESRAGATFPARDPRVRIDAIFAGPGLTVVSYGGAAVPAEDLTAASDHRPVVAEIARTPSARA
ncbi:endonuclease/exonuclease/phosphatase family protein [Microbispora bryophytorum]|uniref:Metal-dependent hydrolase n=1 Tax=Microbispora bryophytorum TaxID=1460882 RepID=A0A8H9GYX7_9ACTN|nr:endonuclease/exonuclease/phosphatase family protein [Microbispora bryophytorum]MBD3134929.1 endonuclease/exonuclease/phosphatase family protein [Microbispora bryophytorum]TQS08824.1 endonuclease/exonuclease/phosphatase [Microbispora bryophytorum]GGO11535.1 metal-dependent hydrolase [Microbispora bryophytorum]